MHVLLNMIVIMAGYVKNDVNRCLVDRSIVYRIPVCVFTVAMFMHFPMTMRDCLSSKLSQYHQVLILQIIVSVLRRC
jgi:hypothetical protein